MRLDDPNRTPVLYSAAPRPRDVVAMRSSLQARPFGEVLAQARQAPPVRTVVSGDTLVGIVREQAAQRGVQLSGSEALKQAQQLASDSGIADAGRIFPGQKLSLEGLANRLASMAPATSPGSSASSATAAAPAAQVLARAAAATSQAAPTQAQAQARPVLQQRQVAAAYGSPAAQPVAGLQASRKAEPVASSRNFLAGPHPVLEQTLDRAVARGFIPAIERGDVYDKILQLASRHKFRPDDFARLTLMESDGMNPKATNERCHGIIQFCDGNDRGAATVGFSNNPRAILGFSVYQQLHLVDKYFSEVGAKTPGSGSGPASLDELYLAVLMPSARSNAEVRAPLNIPGSQAQVLHVGRDRSSPITRQSILEGLQHNANERLSNFAQRLRAQAMRDDSLPGAAPGTLTR